MKKIVFLLLSAAMVFVLTGCDHGGSIYSNYREVEQLQLIRTLGVDPAPEGLRLTVSSGKTGEDGSSTLMSRPGESIALAVEDLQHYSSSQELYYAHADYFLFGEEAARQNIHEVLGYIERSASIPMGVGLFVVRGGSAEELMTGSGSDSYDVSETLSSFERVEKRHGHTYVFTCTETARALSESGAALICALSAQPLEGSVYGQDAEVTAVPDGFGILSDGKLAGYISAKDALAACLLTDNAGLASLAVSDGDGGAVTLTLNKNSVEFHPVWVNNSLERVDVRVSVDARIIEMSRPHAVTDKSFLDTLGTELKKELTRRVEAVLAQESALGADFLGLGSKLREQDFTRFQDMDPAWEDAVKGLDFQVNVDARIGRTSELKNSVSVNGKGAEGNASP